MSSDQKIDNCSIMANVATSSYLRITLFISLILSIFVIPLSIQAIRITIHSKLLHLNSKLIMIFYNFGIILHCISRICLNSSDLIVYFSDWQSGCDILPTNKRCFLRAPFKFSQYLVEISSLFFAVERLFATLKAKKYEFKFKLLGIFLVFFQLFIPFLIVGIQHLLRKSVEDLLKFYCTIVETDETYLILIPDSIIFISHIASLPLLFYLFKRNKKFRLNGLATATLSQRYQINENLRSIRFFQVVSLTTFIFIFFTGISSFYIHRIIDFQRLGNHFANVENVQCLPIYFLIYHLFVWWIQKESKNKIIVENPQNLSHHFEGLRKTFDAAFEQKLTPTITVRPVENIWKIKK